MTLQIFMYSCPKSIQIAKKLVSREKVRRQVFIVLNLPITLYSNLIGQKTSTRTNH